jgi:site-specific DNA-cytosine methylase
LGLDAEWGIYTASQAGAPHKRARVFVLAYCRER